MHRVAAEGHPGLTLRRQLALVAVGVALVALAVVHRFALGDLRRMEEAYIAAREATACANQSLLPFAFGDVALDELDAAVERAIEEALAGSRAVRRSLPGDVTVVPPVPDAHRALADALDAQVSLYVAMRDDPDHSRDELVALGRANARFERRAAGLRRLLFVAAPQGWARRYVCDESPPS